MNSPYEDASDVTNNVFYPKNDPWDTFDAALGFIRDGFAAIGVFTAIIALVLWWTGKV